MLAFRYLCKEVLGVTLAILVVMLLILLVSQSAFYLNMIAKGLIAYSFLGKLILINIPFLMSYILPFAFYFGLLLAYGRLYADSEMVVLQASGFSETRLMAYSLLMAFLVTALSAYLILYLNPVLIKEKGKILLNSGNDILQSVVPQSFRVLNEGRVVVYVGSISRDHKHLDNVFLAQLDPSTATKPQQSWTVDYINSADQVMNSDHFYLRTSSGSQYKGIAGKLDYTILNYAHYDVLMSMQSVNQKYERLDGFSTKKLWHDRADLMTLSELEWRFGLVLQIFVLTLFAVPLSRVRPRQGRYAKFLPAALFYVIFANLLFFGRFLLENKTVSSTLGIWWVFMVMLLIIIVYHLLNSQVLWRRR